VTPSGRLDGFVWRVPLAEIGVTRPVIEVMPPEPAVAAPTAQARPGPATAETAAEPAMPATPDAQPARPRPAEPVIPLVHAPDDPGPGAGLETEAGPEAAVPADGQRWQKIKDLFK
jgi:HemY protein